MKRFTTLVLVIFALAAVPSAFADDGSTPAQPAPVTTVPAAQQPPQRPVRPVQDPTATTTTAAPADRTRPAERVHNLRQRVHAWVRHCVARTGAAPERCYELIKKILDRLGKLDDRIQARIAKIQETCAASSTASSTEDKCKNADKRVERLTKLDDRVKTVMQKAQDWLDGKGTPPADAETSLDNAAQNLGQLAGSNG